MRSYIIISMKTGLKFHVLFMLFLFIIIDFIKAQTNTSYNVNSIPVNNGNYNTVFGLGAFLHNSTGSYNAATGFYALDFNTTGSNNTGTGYGALYSNTTGSNNTANGYAALDNNTTGYNNTASGYLALLNNITGWSNTAHGYQTLNGNTTGSNNAANGLDALLNNTTGNFNTANGSEALSSNTTGNNNTALGDSAGFSSLGSSNVFIGTKAGANETGSNKMYIGNDAAKTLIYGDFSTGQVLLGKGNPNGYVFKGSRSLNVLGGVLADSVRIALSGTWADNVFNKDYQLKSLNELEQFISINKHLPDIPTTSEVKSNGINVADMQISLLKKIEELTLYVIDLKKESEKQQEEIKKLKSKMK